MVTLEVLLRIKEYSSNSDFQEDVLYYLSCCGGGGYFPMIPFSGEDILI
jgi:hypothetical protein